jgi:hypothetical protein
MAFCHERYTTNFPLDDLTGGNAWVATHHEGEPLTPEHGGPARLLVPHLYFWKSAKWVAALRIMDHEEPGFWEANGHHVTCSWRATASSSAARSRRFFVWRGESPVVLVAGGSGDVPLIAMLRHRRSVAPELPMHLLYSVRGADDVIYANDVDDDVTLAYTREPPPGWSGHTGRIDAKFVAAAEPASATCFVCGMDGFVSAASGLLIEAGADRPMIRTERFGPTGG